VAEEGALAVDMGLYSHWHCAETERASALGVLPGRKSSCLHCAYPPLLVSTMLAALSWGGVSAGGHLPVPCSKSVGRFDQSLSADTVAE
jgi:hypothetical protein